MVIWELISSSFITLFYSKRFKRILPLYLSIILLSLMSLYKFFPETAIQTNTNSATHALIFVSNRPSTEQEDYFQLLSIAVDIFTHTWSLSVEVQFYFLIPFIFLIGHRLSCGFQNSYYIVLSVLSFAYFFTSPSQIAFNSVFARMWQFFIGMLVFLGSQWNYSKCDYIELKEDVEEGFCENLLEDLVEEHIDNEKENLSMFRIFEKEMIVNLTIFMIITILILPFPLPAIFLRPFITIMTGFLIFISHENLFLCNKTFVYIGDISYVLYLTHWPIYAYWKLTANENQYELIGALLTSIFVSIVIHEFFEKWYLTLSSTNIGLMVILLYICNVAIINYDDIKNILIKKPHPFIHTNHFDGISENMTMDDAKFFNYQWSVNDYNNLYAPSCTYEGVNTPLGWCRHQGLKSNGKYRMMIFGNSWTANHAKMFYEECGYKAKSILQGSAYGCEPLYISPDNEKCKDNFTDFEERIRQEKPDVAFLITRFISTGDPSGEGLENDVIYQTMKKQLLKIAESVKIKLFILDYMPRIKVENIENIVPMLKKKQDPVKIDNLLVSFNLYDAAQKRHNQLYKDCGSNCERIDYTPEFYNKPSGTYRFFDDRGFSYFTTSTHLSPHGIEHVRHVWTDLCRDL